MCYFLGPYPEFDNYATRENTYLVPENSNVDTLKTANKDTSTKATSKMPSTQNTSRSATTKNQDA